MLALLLTVACTPPPPAYAPDLSRWTGPELACVEKHCGSAASEEALGACRAERCAATAPSWSVDPTLLRYEDGVVTMTVQVGHAPGAFGDVPAAGPEETWLGATVLTTSGEEIDMAVQTVFPDRLAEPFTFSSEVGEGVEVVIVGLWGKKIEPCDSTRSGCRMFGFVLDESLAAWPAETYVATPPRRQRFLPSHVSVLVNAAGLTPEQGEAARAALDAALAAEGQRLGATFDVGQAKAAPVEPGTPREVRHKHVHDGPLASLLADALAPAVGQPWTVRHDPDAPADLVFAPVEDCPTGVACR